MARMTTEIRSFNDARRFLDSRESRKLGHNTEVVRWNDGAIAIVYHTTAIIVYRHDGAIRLASGGWMSTTTKQRLNACSPYSVWSEGNGDWAVSGMGDSARFVDQMWSDLDGRWQDHKAAQFASRNGRTV